MTWTPFTPKPERWWGYSRRMLPSLAIGIALALVVSDYYRQRNITDEREIVRVDAAPSDLMKWILLDDPDDTNCLSDLVASGIGSELTIPSISAPPTCNTELTVFAQGFAPELTLAPHWGTSVISVQLKPRWAVSLNIVTEYSGALAAAENEVIEASSLFDQNRMGMDFTITETRELTTADAPLLSTIRGQPGPGQAGHCDQASAITNSELYRDGFINVFYVAEDQWKEKTDSSDTSIQGRTCSAPYNDLIFIREGAVEKLLAHELGHAMSLLHTEPNWQYEWLGENLMRCCIFDPNPDREQWKQADHFSLGQACRANVHVGSWVNNGVREGDKKDCGDENDWYHYPCPRPQLDWQ